MRVSGKAMRLVIFLLAGRAIVYGMCGGAAFFTPPPCGEGGRQVGGVFMLDEVPSPTPPHKGEGLHAPSHTFIGDPLEVRVPRLAGFLKQQIFQAWKRPVPRCSA
jgi:hypothetical protein